MVLDNIRSGLNVGSIFRTADAFSVQQIHLCGITARPPDREVLKTALGANETVSWQYFEDVSSSLQGLLAADYTLTGVEQLDQSIALQNADFQAGSRIALIFGNEVRGLSPECYALLHTAIEIPQFGTKHSFNVAVSAGIVMWEYFRQTRP